VVTELDSSKVSVLVSVLVSSVEEGVKAIHARAKRITNFMIELEY